MNNELEILEKKRKELQNLNNKLSEAGEIRNKSDKEWNITYDKWYKKREELKKLVIKYFEIG